jgi:ABC-type nickel/cobalt efflux system permease component RcnA
MNKCIYRLMLAFMLGLFISVFSYGAVTSQAAESQVEISEDENVAMADSAESDDGSGGVFLLMAGMLLIIIAVVITVVASFVVTAPIVDEI